MYRCDSFYIHNVNNDNFIHVLCMYRCESFYIHNVNIVRPLEGDFYFCVNQGWKRVKPKRFQRLPSVRPVSRMSADCCKLNSNLTGFHIYPTPPRKLAHANFLVVFLYFIKMNNIRVNY